MVFVCIVLAVILVFVLVRHLHFVWQIKSINEQIEFINTHETNKIVTGEYRNGSITDLINNINALSRQCSILKTQCLTNESNMKETIMRFYCSFQANDLFLLFPHLLSQSFV